MKPRATTIVGQFDCHPERAFLASEGSGRADSRRRAKGTLPYSNRPTTATALVLLAGLLVLPLFAQLAAAQMAAGAAPDKQEVMAKMEKLSSALQLTPQQKKQMMPILMEESQKMKSIKTDTSLGPLQKVMQMKEVGSAADAKIQPILTPQQYQKFEQIRTQEREEMMQKMREGQQ